MQKFIFYINGLPWSQQLQADSTRKAFISALANGVWQQTAVYQVYDKIQQAGGGLTWQQVKRIWREVLDDHNGKGGSPKAPIVTGPKPVNSATPQSSQAFKPKPTITGIAANGRVLGNNGNDHHNSAKPHQKRPSSLVGYYA